MSEFENSRASLCRFVRRWCLLGGFACALVACSSGAPPDIPSPRALSPSPTVDAAALADFEQCQDAMQPLMDALDQLDKRLDGAGLVNTAYGHYLGDITVAYHDVPFHRISHDCVRDVAIHARNAFDEYVKADAAWDRCIKNFACDTGAIEGLQRHWAKAFREIQQAEEGLSRLEP